MSSEDPPLPNGPADASPDDLQLRTSLAVQPEPPAKGFSKELHLADFPAVARGPLAVFDTDGDGKISLNELNAAVHHFQNYGTLKQREKRNRIIVIVAAVLFIIATLSQFGVMIAAVRLLKDTVVTGRVMTTVGGDPVQTASTDFYVSASGLVVSRATGAAASVNASKSGKRELAAAAL